MDRLATQVIACLLAYMIAIWPVMAQQPNVIVPDGRTATTVTANGNVSTVTTGTVSGSNAFNSFSQFQIGAGGTGNLILPNGTSNLINLVNGGAAVVNGVLNSYKDGSIGGNVYFADPYGFVVGKSGVANVGSLNVSTPTRDFMDSMISPSGQINQGAVNNLLAGTVPISPDGYIRILGRVNAVDAVRLTGQNVFVGSGRDAINRVHAVKFASTVNSKGLRSGNAIVVRNGSIQIVAAGSARISGRLVARSRTATPGDIVVTAGGAIRIASNAKLIAASKHGDAGNVILKAGGDLTLQTGAIIDASSTVGNAGLVDLSSNGTFNIAAGIKINLGSTNGNKGTLLIDPTVVVIGDSSLDSGVTLSNSTVANSIAALVDGGTYVVSATDAGDSITLAPHAVIDTRRLNGSGNSTGNAYNVELDSPTIDIQAGAQILAQAVNSGGSTWTSGNVVLNAASTDNQAQLPSSATSSITIAGTITGASISATATSTASTTFTNSALGMAQFGAGFLLGALAGVNGNYVKSEASAKVTVESTANLTASGAITLSSIGSETASDPAITFSLGALQSAVGAAVIVGITNADIASEIKSGATISSGDLNVLSSNNTTLNVSALTVSASTALDGAFAYSTGTVNTKALVDPGATITKVGNVTVGAQNTNNFSTSATTFAGGTGQAGVAVAYSDVTNNAVANLGASIPSTASAGAVTVYSGSNTQSNSVSASSSVGSSFGVSDAISSFGGTFLTSFFASGGPLDGTDAGQAASSQGTTSNTSTSRLGLVLSLNLSSLNSSASIAAIAPDVNGNMVSSGTAPTIVASGGVGVISTLTDAGIRGNAESTINSPEQGTARDPSTQSSVSMAVNVDQLTQSSNAYIGSGVSVTAPYIGVNADMSSPITITWLDFDSFSAVTSHLNGNLGIVNDILTSYANSTSDSASTGLSGALNYFEITSNTTAWVGSGATLKQSGATQCTNAGVGTCWSSNLSASGLGGAPASFAWANDIVVQASTMTSTINIGGNFSWLTVFGTNSTSQEGTAIGGSANVNIFNTNTVAGIGAGAQVTTNGTLDVSATTSDLIYAVAPTSGKGSGLGLNGIVSVLQLDNTTTAVIDSSATVSASAVIVNAQQNISSFDIGGGVGASKGTGVGVVVAIASMSADTSAFIGDSSTALSATGATADDSNLTPTSAGSISAFNLYVDALTVGRLTTVAVAAQYNNNTPDPADPPDVQNTQPSSLTDAAIMFFKNIGTGIATKLQNAYNSLAQTTSGPVNGGNSTAGAGSAAVDVTSMDTSASIADATVKYTPGGNNNVSVQALDNTIIDTASGAAALSKGAPGTDYTVGLAGAVAVTLSSDMTTATIAKSSITAHDTTVQALAGGENTTVGLAVAITAGSGNGVQGSASVSVAEINDGVQAGIDSSTVGQTNGGDAGALSIIAYQTTSIGIGAGSLYGGFGSSNDSNNNGLGVAMTYAAIGDPSSGAAVSAVLSNSSVQNTASLNVEALDTSRILSGAAVAGGGANASGFAGAVIVNDIDPTILAEITSLPAVSGTATIIGGITVSGDVTVTSSGGSVATLDALIANASIAANGGLSGPTDDSGLDFTGAALSPTSPNGAAILAVAGNVQVGRSNVGISIVVNRIGTRHEALIDRASVTSSGGVVSVLANDNAEIIGIAIGVGGASGSVAGNGSVAYNAIDNAVIAQIGHGVDASDAANTATATVQAAAVSVTAQDNATIRGAAGAISINIGGGDAVGLSAAVDQISTYVSAALVGSHVTADNALSDNSSLITGNLNAGTVLVAGNSDANIVTVSIGAAISIGNNSSSPATPQSNLASLVAAMAPAAPSSLTGFGGGGVTPPTQPAPPSAPSVPSDGMSGAGSLALSTEATSVYSAIGSGGNGYNSAVDAKSNGLVLASNADSISAYGGALSIAVGAGKGVGASIVVNTISGTTAAQISSSSVDAHGAGNGATIDSGMLANSIDPSSSMDPASDPNLSDSTQTIKGIAVVASSQQSANTVSVMASVATTGAAMDANAVTNVMGGTTSATVQSASLNTQLSSGENSAVQVTAASASFANNLDLGIADSGSSGSGTIALTINMMNRTTTAKVDTTNIGSSNLASGPIGVLANAFQGTSGEVVGAAGSGDGAGFAGSALANSFQSTTTASLDHGTLYSDGLSVQANGLNGFFGAIGAGALGGSAGIGATVLVMTSNNTIQALVGDSDPATAATTLHLTGALAINATNQTTTSSYAIVGAIGGTAGIAAQFSGMFINNTVDAELDNAAVTNTASTLAGGAVTVSAQETDSITPIVGGVSGGGTAGIGAGVNLVILKNNTKALMAGATVNTGGNVTVSSLSDRVVEPITAIASLGGEVGIAGTVGVVLVGTGASSDEMSVLNAGASNGDSSSGTLGNAGAATGTDVVGATGSGVDGISAQILNSSVTSNKVNISAASTVGVRNIVGALAVGLGGGGFGAAVGFTEVDQQVTARATGGSLTAPTVSISASAGDHSGDHAAESWGIAGAGGLYVGLGAAVGKATVDNTILAELGSNTDGGTNGGTSSTIAVNASDNSTLASYGYGFGAGAAAVGLSLGFSIKTSSVTADIAPSTDITNFASVMVTADGSGSVDSTTYAGAAGVGSGAGASAQASDSETITADIGHNAAVSAAGTGVLVNATAVPDVSATSYGVAVGGVGMGASVAEATAAATVTAYVDYDSNISGGGLIITASALLPSSGHTADAYAVAAGGGVLFGAQATFVQAEDNSNVSAYGGQNLVLPSANVTIAAENDTNQLATATGVAVGWIGVGATVSETSSNGSSVAYLDTGAVTASSNLGVLSISATGTDSNTSNSTAGSGGVYAGAAAIATTSSTSTTSATLKGDSTQDTLYFGGLGINATHTVNYSANGDAFQASAVGASGGSANNTVNDTVTAEVGSYLIINSAGGNMNVIASDYVNEASGGARAGSGGVAAGAATLSSSTVTQTVESHIDDHTIFSLNDNPATSTAAIDIEAYNFLNTTDTVSLTAGGLFAGGGAKSTMDATATDTVAIDDSVWLFSAGNISIGTASRMTANNNANANLYGLVTGAGAETKSDQKVTQTVTVGASKIEGWGIISIYAGQSGDGDYNTNVSSNGTTVVYNYAVIPISADYKGASSAESDSTLTLATGSQILGANNVFLGSTPGSVVSNGSGTNYNPYLSLFSTENHDDEGATPITTGAVILNGAVAAGIHNQDNITISYGDTVTLSSGASPYGLSLELLSDPSLFSPVMSYNHQTIQYAVVGGFNPKQDVISQIASLSGQTSTQVTTQLAAGTTPTAQNDDSAGTKQRQINTLVQEIAYMVDASGPSFVFGNILASAGNVSILATTLSGSIVNGVTPSVTAYDSPKISIDNQGIKFLFVSDLALSGVSGGRVNFTGAATDSSVVQSSTQGITFNRDLSALTPSIIVNASYNATNINRQPIDQSGNVLSTTPDIYFGGTVTNVNGLLSVTNQLGNVLLAGNIDAGTVAMTVPNGMIGGSLGANSVYNSNYDVASQWTSVEYRPTDVLTAVEAAATYLGAVAPPGTPGIAYIDGNGSQLPYYYYTGENQGSHYAPINSSGYSDPSQVFTARLLSLYYDSKSLYSAIFLPIATTGPMDLGGANAAARTSMWQRHDFQNQAYGNAAGNDSGPFYCEGCNPYFQIVDLQNQVINNVTANSASAASPSTITAGKALIISAAVVNINGNISVGQSSNYSVNIGTDALNAINALKNDATALAQAKVSAASGHYVDLTSDVSAANGSDVKISASYDAATDQILLSPVVQGTGGYVYLNGKIISTSSSGNPMGNITVHGGAGTVTVNNTTGVDLVTSVINTGTSAASVVEFVDQAKNQTTWYVYNAGAPANSQVSIYQEAGVNNGGYTALTPTSVTANANLQYLPANQLYQWVDSATLTRPDINDMTVFGWNFSGVSANGPIYPYSRSAPTVISGTQSTNFSETITATGAQTTYTLGTGNAIDGTDFKNGNWYQERYYNLTLQMTNTVRANFGIGVSFTGGGTSNIAVNSNSNIVVNASINNLQGNTSLTATGLTSTGAPSSITGGASPFISGVSIALSAPGGIGSSTAPLPIATYGGTLTATSVDSDIALSATGGLSVAQVKADPAIAGGAPQGNIYLSATGDITSASPYDLSNPIIVGKSITINTSGGAIGAVSGVDGNGLATLTNINPIVIEATATQLSDGTYDGGLLNSSSTAGAYIIQSTGNLRLGTISSTGAVFLEAAAADGRPANILNGLTSGGLTKAQTDYLQSVWTNLNLLGNGSGPPQSVVSYQSMINGAYNDYWQLRNLAFADGTTYSISALGTSVIASQLAANLGVDASTITAQQIQTEATTRFQKDEYLLGIKTAAQLGVSLDTLFGTQAGQASQFQAAVSTTQLTAALTTYDSSFTYTLPTTSTLYVDLSSGSRWTQDQLTYVVSAGANPENNVAPPSITSLPLNVNGRQVMLYAPQGTIGSLATPQTFSFTSDGSLPLSDLEKGLMASAGPGQLTVTTSTYNGPNGAVPEYTVSIAQQSLVKVSPLGTVSAKAQDQIYLGSASDLSLGGIPLATFGPIAAAYSAGAQTIAGGDVVLQAVGSILGGVPGQVAISGNITDLTLISETGSIGAAAPAGTDPAQNDNALLLALSGPVAGNLDQLQATHGIYIRQTTGDLVLGNVNAGSGSDGVLQLGATGSIYAESGFTDRTAVHIVASALDLRAGGNISFNGTTFQPLQVNISGAVTGNASGDVTILSPASNLTIGATGTYGVLTTGGALTLDTIAGAIAINADVTSVNALQLLANNAITFAAGTSADPIIASSTAGSVTLASATLSMDVYSAIDAFGTIGVTTTGDATLGQLKSTASFVAAGNGPSITVAAGGVTTGAILSNGDGQTNLLATGASAEVSLNGSSIGTSLQRVKVDAPLLTATATTGGMYLNTLSNLEATLLSSVNGNVDVLAAADLLLDSVVAGTAGTALGTFTADVSGSLTIGTATSTGTQQIHATQDVNFTTLTANGIAGDAGDVTVTADNGLIQGTTVAANGSASLTAATTNKGMTLTATTGSATLNAGGLIDWPTVSAGTTIDIHSTGDSVSLDTATSGGSQTIHAAQDVNFTTLTTNGITGDAGDVTVTADNGLIQGTTVAANGSASLTAATTNKGTTLTATTGSATLNAGGLIDWPTLNAGTTINVHSTGDAVTLGTATSGGSQTIHANQDVTFSQLTTTGIPGDQGDISVTSDHGTIVGGSVAANGDATFNSGVSINLVNLTAGSATLSAPHDLSISLLSVYRAMTLAADTIEVTAKQLASNPPVPLHATVTGYQGGVATNVHLTIDPPQVIVDQLSATDVVFTVDSPSLTISSGYVPGQMMLTTPAGIILLDDRGPGPVGGVNLQLYEPDGVFTMQQIGNANFSDTQVVYFDTTISSTIINYGGGNFTGSSFVRNSLEDMRNGDGLDADNFEKGALLALYLQGLSNGAYSKGPIEVIGNGPAVNIEGLFPSEEGRRHRRGNRKNVRSSSVENRGAVSFASIAYGK